MMMSLSAHPFLPLTLFLILVYMFIAMFHMLLILD